MGLSGLSLSEAMRREVQGLPGRPSGREGFGWRGGKEGRDVGKVEEINTTEV